MQIPGGINSMPLAAPGCVPRGLMAIHPDKWSFSTDIAGKEPFEVSEDIDSRG